MYKIRITHPQNFIFYKSQPNNLQYLPLTQKNYPSMYQNEHSSRISESWIPTRYESTKNQFKFVDRYIVGLTREEVSQYITGFPFIYHIYKKNNPNDQWKLLDQLMRVPSDFDGPGFIYGFMNERQNSLLEAPYWIKIGRTKQNPPQQRIFQWQREDEMEITQIFTVRTLYQKKLQALVHILFAYARQNRHINGKQRVEWFHFDEITLTAAAVNILNHIMNTIHTKKLEQKPRAYMNRNLKQITDKIKQSNLQIYDIIGNEPKKVVESFVRDLGIQMGNNNQEIKLKLKDCGQLSEMLGLVNEFVIGQQMKIFIDNVKEMEEAITKYLDSVVEYRIEMLQQIKQLYDKTKINIVNYEGKSTIKKEKSQSTIPKEKKSRSIKPESTVKDIKPRKKSSKLMVTQTNIQLALQQITIKMQQLSVTVHQEEEKQVVKQEQKSTDASEIKTQPCSNVPEETVNVRVYNSDGKEERIETIPVKQLHKTKTSLKKYRNGPKPNNSLFPPIYPQKQPHQPLLQQNFNPQPSPNSQHCTTLQFKVKTISQILNHYKPPQLSPNHQYIIYASQFQLDNVEIKLDCGYLILARNVIIDNNFIISRNKGFKCSLNVFCMKVEGADQLKIEKNCQKYVGIYLVSGQGNCDIVAIDNYHRQKNKIDESVKTLGNKLLSLFATG